MSQFQLIVIESSLAKGDRFSEIVRRMNEKFRNQEQFLIQLDAICTEIAFKMKGKMDQLGNYIRVEDKLIFNFTYLTETAIRRQVEKTTAVRTT